MLSRNYLKHWLVIAFAIETFCITYGMRFPPLLPLTSIIYFLTGISIAVLLLHFPDSKPKPFKDLVSHSVFFYYKSTFILCTALVLWFMTSYWLMEVRLDYQNADMLPIIKVMSTRFVHGQWHHVYDIIPEIWHGIQPIYLPGMWMPFSLGVLLNIDIRWVTALCLLFVFSIFFFILRPKTNKLFSFTSVLIAFILFWWVTTENDMHGFISVSEEGVVGVYYVLLVLGLITGNIFVIGIAASFCMMSRYALIGWIPAYSLYLLVKDRKKFIIFASTGILMFIFLLLLPFGVDSFIRLARLPENYVQFAKNIWKDSPDVIPSSIGFSKFFGPNHVSLMHTTLLCVSFIAPISFMIGCLYKSRKKPLSNIPLATLKVAVVVFYNFIDVPFLYLFYTSSFITMVGVAYFTRDDQPMPVGRYS